MPAQPERGVDQEPVTAAVLASGGAALVASGQRGSHQGHHPVEEDRDVAGAARRSLGLRRPASPRAGRAPGARGPGWRRPPRRTRPRRRRREPRAGPGGPLRVCHSGSSPGGWPVAVRCAADPLAGPGPRPLARLLLLAPGKVCQTTGDERTRAWSHDCGWFSCCWFSCCWFSCCWVERSGAGWCRVLLRRRGGPPPRGPRTPAPAGRSRSATRWRPRSRSGSSRRSRCSPAPGTRTPAASAAP